MQVGHEATRVDRRARGEPLERTRTRGHRLLGELLGLRGRCGEDRLRVHRLGERERVGVAGVTEVDELGKRTVRERGEFGIHERLVGAGGAAHGLRRVVDEDVEGAGGCDVIGETDHLGGIAQVDANDLEPADPLGGVGQAREASHGIAREARRDGRVRAIPQQAQRDVHADLRATAGEQGALAREVGAGVALGVAHGRAVRAQLVIEGVDERVRLLADVARARLDEGARGRGAGALFDRDAAGLVVDAVRRPGRGRRDHGPVGLGDGGAQFEAAGLLDGLEHLRGRLAHGDEIGVVLVEVGHAAQHPEGGLEVGGVDGHTRLYVLCTRGR